MTLRELGLPLIKKFDFATANFFFGDFSKKEKNRKNFRIRLEIKEIFSEKLRSKIFKSSSQSSWQQILKIFISDDEVGFLQSFANREAGFDPKIELLSLLLSNFEAFASFEATLTS